jgi:hypothetical protein
VVSIVLIQQFEYVVITEQLFILLGPLIDDLLIR